MLTWQPNNPSSRDALDFKLIFFCFYRWRFDPAVRSSWGHESMHGRERNEFRRKGMMYHRDCDFFLEKNYNKDGLLWSLELSKQHCFGYLRPESLNLILKLYLTQAPGLISCQFPDNVNNVNWMVFVLGCNLYFNGLELAPARAGGYHYQDSSQLQIPISGQFNIPPSV